MNDTDTCTLKYRNILYHDYINIQTDGMWSIGTVKYTKNRKEIFVWFVNAFDFIQIIFLFQKAQPKCKQLHHVLLKNKIGIGRVKHSWLFQESNVIFLVPYQPKTS